MHRDLKPANILLQPDGDVKLADFGCARQLVQECHNCSLRESEMGAAGMVGTPLYMSPEACRGDLIGFPSDVWSLGITVCQLLTGSLPYDDELNDQHALYRFIYALGAEPETVLICRQDTESLAIEVDSNLEVLSVSDGPAKAGQPKGVERGWRILSVADCPVKDTNEYAKAVADAGPRFSMTFTVDEQIEPKIGDTFDHPDAKAFISPCLARSHTKDPQSLHSCNTLCYS